ncbi:MAG: DMT family transporter [Brachybacterium sp.]|uniref:EamA family transporter n=1 Tax=Brachybacterium sp. TaxID=1891286 RepID=UPI00264A40B2|nr:EamA family transporter [Brachybacterium sp.]MDN5685656.1 DMT family transporter [Brachybacterium sp.]
MSRGSLLGAFAVLAAAFLWGTTGTAATFAPTVGPLAMGAAALGIGGILQAVIAVPPLRRERAALSSHRGTVIAGAAAVVIYPLAFYSSMHLAGVAVGTAVSLGSAPIASGLLERMIMRRRLSRWWMLAAVLGIAGCAVLCAATMHDAPSEALPTVAGVALGLVAGATYALYSWSAHRLMSRGVGRAAAMGAVFGLGGTALMPVLLLTGAPLVASAQAFAVGTYMALIPMFLGYLLFGYGLTRVSASTATTLTLAEPAVAAVLAVVIVGERLPVIGWAGLAGICASLLILALAPATHEGATETSPSNRRPVRQGA